MNKKLSFLLICLISICSFGQYYRKTVDAIVKKKLSKFPETGLVIGIYNGLQTSYYSYGSLTKENKTKPDSTTLFEIGSATKTFTAVLLAQEIEKGNAGQFDFIDAYLPKDVILNCRLKEKILLTDLASHQSGLPNLSNDAYFSNLMEKDPFNPFRFVDRDYLYNILRSTDSLSKFRQYQYNNYAFAILGDLLSYRSNIKYEQMIKERILKPLKMTSTSFEVTTDKNRAGLYSQQNEVQQPMILNKVNPAGGLHSNAVDLMKYLKAFLQNSKFAGLRRLTEKAYFEDNSKKIGLGWELGPDFVEKDGDTFGNSTLIRYSPEKRIAIVVLSNHQNGQLVRDVMTEIYTELHY